MPNEEQAVAKAGERWPMRRIALVGVLGGMAAGTTMGLVEMLYGWASDAHTFWAAPMAIWAWIAGANHFGEPANHVGPIVLGLGGHMLNSMLVGVVFALAMSALRARHALVPIVAGTAYGLALWAIMRYGILPLRASTDQLFTTSRVSPQWVWWVAHAGLGTTAGMTYAVARRALARRSPVAVRRRRVPQAV